MNEINTLLGYINKTEWCRSSMGDITLSLTFTCHPSLDELNLLKTTLFNLGYEMKINYMPEFTYNQLCGKIEIGKATKKK